MTVATADICDRAAADGSKTIDRCDLFGEFSVNDRTTFLRRRIEVSAVLLDFGN